MARNPYTTALVCLGLLNLGTMAWSNMSGQHKGWALRPIRDVAKLDAELNASGAIHIDEAKLRAAMPELFRQAKTAARSQDGLRATIRAAASDALRPAMSNAASRYSYALLANAAACLIGGMILSNTKPRPAPSGPPRHRGRRLVFAIGAANLLAAAAITFPGLPKYWEFSAWGDLTRLAKQLEASGAVDIDSDKLRAACPHLFTDPTNPDTNIWHEIPYAAFKAYRPSIVDPTWWLYAVMGVNSLSLIVCSLLPRTSEAPDTDSQPGKTGPPLMKPGHTPDTPHP